MRKRRALAFAALAVTAFCAFQARPYIGSLWYVHRDRQLFPASPPEADPPPLNLPLDNPALEKWEFVNAFPTVPLDSPTVALFQNDGTVFVLERAGRIWALRDDQGSMSKTLLLDFTDKVGLVEGEEGAVGMVLHPDFGQPTEHGRTLFIYYTSHNSARFDRLERLSFDANFRTIPRDSAVTLIDQRDDHYDHNAGDLHFGADGFLYLSMGDEGNCDCGNNQLIDKDLFGGILRIDVDKRGGAISHPPRRQPKTGTTTGYYIPNDNPFVDVPNAIEEFWSIGLRNPYRFSIDPLTHRIFGGDVGRLRVESVFEASKGSNHRWSRFEGNLEHRNFDPVPDKLWGHDVEPVVTYRHENLNHAIIGGLIYRGAAYPELQGRYIYGDNSSGRVWALDLATKESRFLCTLEDRGDSGLAGFSQDARGELFAITLGLSQGKGMIQKLQPSGDTHAGLSALPQKLSELGFFADMKTLRPVKTAVSYALNLPMWHGFARLSQRNWAIRLRWRSMIRFAGRSEWQVPGGMLFVKHFDLSGRRIETQFLLVSSVGNGYGLSYEWNADGSEAYLVSESKDVEFQGGKWRFSASAECSACHSSADGFVLGVSTRQLNRGDQLVRLRRDALFEPRDSITIGMWGFRQPINLAKELLGLHKVLQTEPFVQPDRIATYPRLLRPAANAPLDSRVAAYLDVNCSHCHRPGGSSGAGFDARYSSPWSNKGIIGKSAHRAIDGVQLLVAPGNPEKSLLFKRLSSNAPGTQMPPIGVHTPDPAGVDLLRRWIASLAVDKNEAKQ